VSTYEEWRVTGQPAPCRGVTYPAYEFTWSQRRGDTDPEQGARHFVAGILSIGEDWTDGPHLHKRTVTVTDWTEVDA
jgi:hypothetical protein